MPLDLVASLCRVYLYLRVVTFPRASAVRSSATRTPPPVFLGKGPTFLHVTSSLAKPPRSPSHALSVYVPGASETECPPGAVQAPTPEISVEGHPSCWP